MLNNIPQVTKNLLLLNILVFILTLILGSKGVDLNQLLSTHAIGSPLFKPYQVVTYMFAHADFLHILMNMWLFVMLGGYLERLWGPKRFFIFFLLCGFGAFLLQNAMSVYQLFELKSKISASGIDINTINYYISNTSSIQESLIEINDMGNFTQSQASLILEYVMESNASMLGASGAVFGVLAAFAILFPNQEFLLYFAIPVKAKFLVGGYIIYEIYQSFQHNPNDQVAHLAHVGGAIAGALIVLYWRKKDRTNFY
jgi:membrane associated rhomboid family serine protease